MKADTKEPISSVIIPATEKQDAIVQDFIDNRMKSPGQYDLYDRNCATTVRDALDAAGIDAPDTALPQKLFNGLEEQYGSPTFEPTYGLGG